ncbi:MAG: hypothetical protein IPO88_10115 [Nannocystis sp.]|nr:hypothetical protein [Nannocystis sp.]MBK9753843.1 hypothetical protein [Nannocystis sp.]
MSASQSCDVDRDGADGLIDVDHDQRADLVGAGADRLDVLQRPGDVDAVGDRDDRGALVDRGEHALQRDRHAVVGGDQVEVGPELAVAVPHVEHVGELQGLDDDLVSGAGEVEGAGDGGLKVGDVLVQDRLAGGGAEEAGRAVGGGLQHVEPVRPDLDALAGPVGGVLGERGDGLSRHGAHAVAVHVGRVGEDRVVLAVAGQIGLKLRADRGHGWAAPEDMSLGTGDEGRAARAS